MKKVIFTLAIAAMLPAAAFAQSNSNNGNCCNTKSENCAAAVCNGQNTCNGQNVCNPDSACPGQCVQAQCARAQNCPEGRVCHKDGKRHHKGNKKVARADRRFRGEVCTERGNCDRLAGLDLTPDQQKALQTLQENHRAEQKLAREQAKADKKESREARRAKAAESREKYLAEVKKILTPEQYTKFLDNGFAFKNKNLKAQRLQPVQKSQTVKADKK